jgi:predicted dehydrogenase
LKKIKNNKKCKIHVGYNHRFHPSIVLAKKLINSNHIGSVLYIRARYGHGARLNYNKEWRMDKKISGGGELIDQGSHLIDLSRLFLGDFKSVKSSLRKFFWKTNGQVDDNAFLVLSTNKNKIAFLHCSCTEWKNKFSFEIFGERGKIEINGLGKSYGTENLTLYKMKKKMGVPSIKNWKFSNKKDVSWKNEINDFFLRIIKDKPIESNILNASKNLKIIDQCYKNRVLTT